MKIMKAIDDESLTVSDIKKRVDGEFHLSKPRAKRTLKDHCVAVQGANTRSNAEMDRIEKDVRQMTLDQQQYDAEIKAKQPQASPSTQNQRFDTN